MKLKLQISPPGERSYTWSHDGSEIRIGRDPTSHLSIGDDDKQYVSWKHARIEARHGEAFITDLDSTNGTYVNEQKVASRQPIHEGDTLRLGQAGPRLTVLELRLGQKGAAQPVRTMQESHVPARADGGAVAASGDAGNALLPAEGAVLQERQPSTTRMIMVSLQQNQRKVWSWTIAAAVAIVVVVGWIQWRQAGQVDAVSQQATALAGKSSELEKKAVALADTASTLRGKIPAKGEAIYDKVLHSIAWVRAGTGTGTGSLVDREKKLLITAFHVVEGHREVFVFFPDFDSAGELIMDRSHYNNDATILRGKVVKTSSRKDLALIKLSSVPPDVSQIAIASESVKAGAQLHTVGNPGASSGLWAYSHGAARQVIEIQFSYRDDAGNPLQFIDAWILESQNPINQGDSGGPIVNDDAELVGVNSGGDNSVAVQRHIDVREVRAFLGL